MCANLVGIPYAATMVTKAKVVDFPLPHSLVCSWDLIVKGTAAGECHSVRVLSDRAAEGYARQQHLVLQSFRMTTQYLQ